MHGADRLLRHGDAEKKVIEPARRGELLFAFAISEERGGSDALGVDTIAVKDGSRWILTGKKCWVTNAGVADGYVVTAKKPVCPSAAAV